MATSCSVFTMIMLLSMPQVARSARIMPGSHSTIVTPLPSTGYTQMDLCRKSFTTSIVSRSSPATPPSAEKMPCSDAHQMHPYAWDFVDLCQPGVVDVFRKAHHT